MITRSQARELLESEDLIALGIHANEARNRVGPASIVTYHIAENAAIAGQEPNRLVLRFGAPDNHSGLLDQLAEMQTALEDNPSTVAIEPVVQGSAVDYLKLLAVCRIAVDAVPYVQTSPSIGLKLCQIALKFGANDINGAEARNSRATEEDIRRIIRDAGYVPKQRDALFRSYALI